MESLAGDKTIIIKPADKGSSVVVWDRSDYLQVASRQLQDKNIYEDVSFSENILIDLVERSNKIFKGLCSHKLISEKELKYFTYNFKKATNLEKLYFLPKIRKRLSAFPGKPVISNCGTPTEKVSEYLDHILKCIIQESWSYVKDSGDFLKKIKNVGEGTILVTADVVGLYPNLPHWASLETLRKRLNQRETPRLPTEELIKMAYLALKNNFFEFSGEVKRQNSGTAIGTKFAPPCACIFMDAVETEVLTSQYLQPFSWLRYIDDIYFIWAHGEKKLVQFLNELNNFHPNLRFTYEISKNNVNFLDSNVSLRDGAIHTDLYIKPTDGRRYLHYQSSHPHYIKLSIPYNQALRVSRICSPEKDFRAHICKMKKWFLARGYPEKVVNNQIDKVAFGKNPPVKKSSQNGIPFVATYHPKVKPLGRLIKDLLPFLYSDDEVEKVFSPPPIASYRSAKKIKDYIVRSKLYPVERSVGCRGCVGSRCQVCENIKVTDTCTSFITKNKYKINHSFDCNDKCLIIARHVVNNIQVKLPTILEVGGTIINLKLEKLRVVTWKILSKSSYRVTFYNQIPKVSLKT